MSCEGKCKIFVVKKQISIIKIFVPYLFIPKKNDSDTVGLLLTLQKFKKIGAIRVPYVLHRTVSAQQSGSLTAVGTIMFTEACGQWQRIRSSAESRGNTVPAVGSWHVQPRRLAERGGKWRPTPFSPLVTC